MGESLAVGRGGCLEYSGGLRVALMEMFKISLHRHIMVSGYYLRWFVSIYIDTPYLSGVSGVFLTFVL